MKAWAILLLITLSAVADAEPAQRPVPSHGAGAAARAPAHEVVRVNGTPIMSDRLDAAVAELIPMESFHRNVSDEERSALRQQALQGLVDDELEFQEGVRQGVKVSDADVKAEWERAASRYGGTTEFEEALRRSGASSDQVRGEFRRSLTIKGVYDREVMAKCRVSPEQAAEFFAANPGRFVEPEQLRIQAITVGVDPSSTAQEWAAAKARAEEALRKLKAGSAFRDAALEYSTDPSKFKDGDLGFVHRGSLNDRFEQVAKDLPVGQLSDVIETIYGYHIIRVSEIRSAQRKAYSEVASGLQKDLTATRCAGRKDAWLAELREKAHVTVLGQP